MLNFVIDFSINGLNIMTDIVELGRRVKRSLDGYITYRKAAAILIIILVFFLYLGPGLVSWILGGGRTSSLSPAARCVHDKLARSGAMLEAKNGHTDQGELLSYIGNGYIGLSVSQTSNINIKSKRTLSIPVHFKPLVSASLNTEAGVREEETVTVYEVVADEECHEEEWVEEVAAEERVDAVDASVETAAESRGPLRVLGSACAC